jgi:hypothetical protein
MRLLLFYFSILFLTLSSCDTTSSQSESDAEQNTDSDSVSYESNTASRNLSQDFKEFWYSGTAEISNYELKTDRYGEPRQGNAVLIFVTEPFDADDQIKADQEAASNRSVFKLNATRDFYTGIYPYKIMSSTFLPLDKDENATKVATSIQEWCGHTFMQLNHRGDHYDGVLYSYFQSEGNESFTVAAALLENQIPLQLRLGPDQMPTGTLQIIPSTEYLRLMHLKTEALPATATLETGEAVYRYRIDYASGRKVEYVLDKEFPYQITSWKEEFTNRGSISTTSATLKKSLRTPYWMRNSNQYSILRDSLAL